jgi:hypothetical protein
MLLDVVATRSDKAVLVHGINRACDADPKAELDLAALVS